MSGSGSSERGFALIAVVWVVAVVTVISMELVASIGLEARGAIARLEALRLERLALGGHEVAAYLDQRGLLAPNADLGNLPVDVLAAGARYRVRFPGGTAGIRFGAENGKVSLTSAPEAVLTGVFTRWSGNAAQGEEMARAVVDWRDPDQLNATGDAESADYANPEIRPRNRPLGVGDAHLIAAFGPEDFLPAIIEGTDPGIHHLLPEGLYSLTTPIPTDGRVNVNFAPVPVLEALPGVGRATARRLAELRDNQPFDDLADLQSRGGIRPGADAWEWITVSTAPSRVVTVIVENDSGMRQVRRRVSQSTVTLNPLLGQLEPRLFLRSDTRFDPEIRVAP